MYVYQCVQKLKHRYKIDNFSNACEFCLIQVKNIISKRHVVIVCSIMFIMLFCIEASFTVPTNRNRILFAMRSIYINGEKIIYVFII